MSSNDSNLVLRAVALGQGIALERRSLVQDAISRGELIQLTEYTAPYPYPYWLVTPAQHEPQAGQRVFVEWLLEEVAAYLVSIS
jgi:LysR family glycine cleavage system transcriptional activator